LILLLAVALGQIAVGHLLTARPKVPRRTEPRPPEPATAASNGTSTLASAEAQS